MNLDRLLLTMLLSMSALFLASCGGGGTASVVKVVNNNPQGIYAGKSGAGNDVIMLVESSDDYWILYVDPNVPTGVFLIENGTATVSAPNFTTTADTDYELLYTDPHNANLLTPVGVTAGIFTYTVDFEFNAQVQISGSILSGSNCISVPKGCAIFSIITPTYVANSSGTMGDLSKVAGNYADNFSSTLNSSAQQAASCDFTTAINIGSNGKITGTLDNCSGTLPSESTVTGTLTARTDIDAFDVTLMFTAGGGGTQPLDGLTFTGIAYYNAPTKRLYIGALTADQSTAVGFSAPGPN